MHVKFGIAAGVFAVGVAISPSYAVLIDGTNLVTNPRAEMGTGSASGDVVVAIPGWVTTGNFTLVQYGAVNAAGAFPTLTSPGPPQRGTQFFAGGPNNASSSATQAISIAADSAEVDTGRVVFRLAGYLGGFDAQGDNAVLSATFLSGSGATLGGGSVGPVTAAERASVSGLLLRETTGSVPAGTRTIELRMLMTRLNPSYNDGYVDNIALSLVPEPSALGLAGSGGLLLLRRRRAR